MKTLDRNSKSMQSLLKTDYRRGISQIEDTQTETAQNEEQYLTGQKSLLFKMYDLEEEDLFV